MLSSNDLTLKKLSREQTQLARVIELLLSQENSSDEEESEDEAECTGEDDCPHCEAVLSKM